MQEIPNPLLFTYGYLQTKYQRIKNAPYFKARSLGDAFFLGHLYEVNDYPGAVYTGKAEDKVYGEVFELFDAKDLIILDNYEMAQPTVTVDAEYCRRIRKIEVLDGQFLDCWVYEYTLATKTLRKISSGKY
ncbi:MAG: gamma-glutamylcyclotransferase family protein [Cyclobacteriaceae bacterium]